MNNLRVIFMGTPEFATNILNMLIKKVNVILVVTQPDKIVGRKKEIQYSPIKKIAIDNNIEVFQPTNIKQDYQKIIDMNPDMIITCAYGQIIPKILLDLPKYKCINVHASLLPKLRGGAPINHAIIDGYDKTGVTIMYMAEGMDNGDIIKKEEYIIKDSDTFGELSNILSEMGTNLLENTLNELISNNVKRIKQNEDDVTYAKIIKREDEHINLNKTGIEIERLVRGLNPYPYANITINDIEIKIVEGYFKEEDSIVNKVNIVNKKEFGIGCINGNYYVTKLKPAGKNIMNTSDFINGYGKEKLLNANIK